MYDSNVLEVWSYHHALKTFDFKKKDLLILFDSLGIRLVIDIGLHMPVSFRIYCMPNRLRFTEQWNKLIEQYNTRGVTDELREFFTGSKGYKNLSECYARSLATISTKFVRPS